MASLTATASASRARKYYRNPTFQVLAAIVLGVWLGAYYPDAAIAMKPLGDGFIRMIRMVIGPIIFLSITTGIAHVGRCSQIVGA